LSVVGATLAARPSTLSAQSPGSAPWQPVRHPQDDWLEQVPGKHRLVFDTTNQEGFGAALRYANNYISANQFGYGLTDADVAVVIIARHDSMQFALTDTMWTNYGASLSPKGGAADSTPKTVPARNRFNNRETAENGVTLDALIKHGVHFAVCQMAARRMAGIIATDTKTDANGIYNELAANVIQNSHMVPAGIVTVNRAQERGYALAIGG
jgi:intracellular sulfur oxidation DsrE/DsrF family protein